MCRFFFSDTATTEIYTLSLHDALPISFLSRPVLSLCVPPELMPVEIHLSQIPRCITSRLVVEVLRRRIAALTAGRYRTGADRSEEHTSELQSRLHLVCRLLLEKKNKTP